MRIWIFFSIICQFKAVVAGFALVLWTIETRVVFGIKSDDSKLSICKSIRIPAIVFFGSPRTGTSSNLRIIGLPRTGTGNYLKIMGLLRTRTTGTSGTMGLTRTKRTTNLTGSICLKF